MTSISNLILMPMKKSLILLVCLLIFAGFNASMAQSPLGAGVKGGISFADQSTTETGENVYVKNLLTFHAGAYLNYFFNGFLAIQPELQVSGKGSTWNDPIYNTRDFLTYIDIPLLLRIQPIKMVNVHAGPQFGYLIRAFQKDLDSDEKLNIRDYYEDFDLGLAVGAEANLPFRINLTVRYVRGLIPANSDVAYWEPWKNHFLQFSVGYRIIGK